MLLCYLMLKLEIGKVNAEKHSQACVPKSTRWLAPTLSISNGSVDVRLR